MSRAGSVVVDAKTSDTMVAAVRDAALRHAEACAVRDQTISRPHSARFTLPTHPSSDGYAGGGVDYADRD